MPNQPLAVPDVQENFDFGGVDSRSNPLNMPLNRAIRNVNWVPVQGGWLRLRYGYLKIAAGAVANPSHLDEPTSTAVHSLDYYDSWDTLAHYALIGQGKTITRMNMADLTRTRVASLMDAGKWNTYRANNKIYLGNGVDMLWYDSIKFRGIGLAPFDTSLFASVVVTAGVRALTADEAAAVTVTQIGSGGTFPVTTNIGLQFYISQFDPTANDVGPAIAVGDRQTIAVADSSFTIAGVPDWSTKSKPWLSLISVTGDGQYNSYFLNDGQVNVVGISRVAGITTVVLPVGESISGGSVVNLRGVTEDPSFNGVFAVTSSAANQFTFNQPGLPDLTAASGIVYDLIVIDNSGDAVTVTDSTVDASFIASGDIGLPATTVVTDNPGYQFYLSPYRINAGGHVGNRIPIGGRLLLTEPSTVRFSGLPDIGTVDPELVGLLGRTADGAQIPYACIESDGSGTYIVIPTGRNSFLLSSGQADFNSELPYRNGVPPPMDKFARVGDRIYGNKKNSPYIYRFASEADQTTGTFVGVAAESSDPGDVETFPTAEAVTCLVDYDSDAWVFSRNNLAILDESAGYVNWQGPYPTGCAGQRAFVKTDHGPYWVSGKRQLCTRGELWPLPISEEYEAGLMSRIGPAYLSATECSYVNDPTKGLDYISIKAQDVDGNPFEIIHDFKLRDDRSPYGSGYIRKFEDALSANFTIKIVEDSDFVKQLWAGGADGELYQLESAWNDNGAEFEADRIALLYFGPERQSAASLQIQGDNQVDIEWLNKLNKTEADMVPLDLIARKGNEDSYVYNANVKDTEVRNAFLRFKLMSHSADAPASFLNGLELNDPPHLPLEVYGAIYVARVEPSTSIGA